MSIKCLIVDDEPLALDALETLLGKIPDVDLTGRCQDGVSALQELRKGKTDLLFLDIEMPELSGLDLLRSLSNPPRVIFTTAYREYAVEAFELDVVDYLVKPISFERLVKAINRYHERFAPAENSMAVNSNEGVITIYSDKKTHKLNTSEILFIEGLKDYAIIHTAAARLVTRQAMKNLEESLSSYDFIRVHRSWIVPYNRISSWTTYSVSIAGREIPVGKTYRKPVREYLEKKIR
jgi:DNA-binding LytR/AlgR family response regulator